MEIVSIGLTVYFEDGFWHGLFEQEYERTYQVCRVTFGQEPKEDEILRLLQLQFEERKKHSKQQSSLQKQLLKQEKFERKQQKRREKHKGH